MTDVQPEAAAAGGEADGAPAEPEAESEVQGVVEPELVPEPAPEPATAVPSVPLPAAPVATFRVMLVEDVSLELPSQYPTVSLIEAEPPMRSLVFPVGLAEGAAMAQAVRRLASRRPMTHELFMDVLQRAHIDVISLRVVGREEGNLLAELDLMTPAGGETLDCRPSDGLVLALRMPVPAPILVDERLLETMDDVAPISTP